MVVRVEPSPRRVLQVLLLSVLVLVLASLLGTSLEFFLGHDYARGFVPMFDLDTEKNVPTYFSAALLLGCGTLLLRIGLNHRKAGSTGLMWAGLAAVFIFLALDEALVIHERLIVPVREALNLPGVFYYAWVVPYGIGLALLAALYLRFLLGLPVRDMLRFLVAGALYVLGALGLELVGGLYADLRGTHDLAYACIVTLEELLEMLGVTLFVHALLRYREDRFPPPASLATSRVDQSEVAAEKVSELG